jgi:hypothetical protein
MKKPENKKSEDEKFDKDLEEIIKAPEGTGKEVVEAFDNTTIDFVIEHFFDEDFQMCLREEALEISREKDCDETIAEELRRFAHSIEVLSRLMRLNVIINEDDEDDEKDNEKDNEKDSN